MLLSLRPRDTWERIDTSKFDGEVHPVAGFKGANVGGAESNNSPVKTVLVVPAGSQDADIGIGAGPGGGRRARATRGVVGGGQSKKSRRRAEPLALPRPEA